MKKWVCFLFFPFALISHHGSAHVTPLGHETVVESNEAHYNGRMITLTGRVSVENAMGKVTAEKAVLTRDESGSTKIDFPWIELTCAVTLTLPDGNHLNCDHVFLDYTKMTSHFTGSPQIAYFDERGEVWADEAFIDYIEVEGSIKPTKVRLVDNVQLMYVENDQYALADLVTYYPDEQLMILEGKENMRVLFFDKQRNMQLSAHTVRALRNPETNKDSIKGVGDVRFVFRQEELSKLKEQFKW